MVEGGGSILDRYGTFDSRALSIVELLKASDSNTRIAGAQGRWSFVLLEKGPDNGRIARSSP